MNATDSLPVTYHQLSGVIDVLLDINGKYLVPIIVISGFINNAFVLVLLSASQYKQHVSCLYLRTLAVFDIIVLIIVGIAATNKVMETLILYLGDPFCAGIGFLSNFAPENASWIIVGITFTRFVAVVYPLKASSW
jgi:general stress protein CsbA